MAPTGKKTETWLEKERITGPRYSRRLRRKRSEPRRRMQTYQSADTQKLVHRLLNAGKHNQGTENKKLTPSQGQWLQKLLRKYREHHEPPHDKANYSDNSASASNSECTVAANPVEMAEATDSPRSTSSSGTFSNASHRDNVVQSMTLAQSIENMRSLLRKEPVVQIINSCFKAGIQEGKRRAKKYVRNVLSFGLNAGYLIPGDLRARATTISPRILESKREDAESRLRRRRARRGEEVPPNVKRKDLRRGTSTRPAAASKAPGADSAEAATMAKKRGRKSKSSSPRTSSNPQGTQSRPEKSSARQGHKRQRATKRKPADKKGSQYKDDNPRHKSASDSRRARSKSHRDSAPENRTSPKFPGNEINRRITRERTRSVSRSKSVPPQSGGEEPGENVERMSTVNEQRRLEGTCCECDD